MVSTLVCFFILSSICLGCIELIRTNIDIINIYEDALKLEYEVEGGINLGYSKILEEVEKSIKIAMADEYPNEIYKDYFMGSNKINFIKSIEDIVDDGIRLDVVNNKIYIEDNCIKLDIVCNKNYKTLEKGARCSFKINLDFVNNNIEDIVDKYGYKEI